MEEGKEREGKGERRVVIMIDRSVLHSGGMYDRY